MSNMKRTASAASLDSNKSATRCDQRKSNNRTLGGSGAGETANDDFLARVEAAFEILRQQADDANGNLSAMRAQLSEVASARSSTPELESDASDESADDSESVHTRDAASVGPPLLDENGEVDLQIQDIPLRQDEEDTGEFDNDDPIGRWQLETNDPWSAPKAKSGENASQRLAHLESWLEDISAQFVRR